ncbi:dTDP-glucose 4,6-dehydratase [Bacillus sp. Marseille-Q3570]|uniref:dTDP-glucose 4,6-dehydratase n=1 Tax=Bacillus sp. Marseille-Q3570 TaxID=2963522 RepID=UPI0021B72B9A|nr:dTDP-glucose 4,6-dehydratase [Bacillus sp. Marseille-Q3570]
MTDGKQTLLVTGGAGFIGSNFIHYIPEKYPDYQIINIDKLTYAGSLANLHEIETNPNYQFIEGDIADFRLVSDVFAQHDITGVIHFAAESHVDNSIENASPFVITNVVGTVNLLQAAKQSWEEKGELSERRFHHISTDEVYGSLENETDQFTEETPYDPRNPYSASKASANMLVKSFSHTHGMNVVISSSSNNYGPRQHNEKLIPTILSKALSLEPIPIYGDGQNIRDWLYVEDHCRALDLIYHQGTAGESYNIGGGNEWTNLDLTMKICLILNEMKPDGLDQASITSFQDLITFVEDRPGHDLRYSVDDRKIRQSLGWKPNMALDSGLRSTVEWYSRKWEKVKI